jgi:FAD/FMN-containing dehydrogenase
MNPLFNRRYFMRSALATIPVAALPYGKLFAADEAGVDVEAVSMDGKPIVLKAGDIKDLGARLRGNLLLASSPGYDDARKIWNGAFDRHPALIARCSGAEDVSEAVRFAAAQRLLVSVRGGGHSLSGQSACDKGLMIDLAQMNSARVDAKHRRAYVEGGALLGALDHESLPHGLATTAGTVSHTGVGGLTLGGGFGRLGRRFGLACDNLRAVDLITADGKSLTASSEENPELFWGLRGGGGNFGVATSFEFQLHSVDPIVLGGSIDFAFTDAAAVLDFYYDYSLRAPDELNLGCVLLKLPDGTRSISFEICYSGPRAQAEKILAELSAVRKPMNSDVAFMPYVALQRSGDEFSAPGLKYYSKSGFVQKPTPALRDALIGVIDNPNFPSGLVIDQAPGGGAYARVKPTDTAFAQRSAAMLIVMGTGWNDPAIKEQVIEGARAAWSKIEPHTHGFYMNVYNKEDSARIRDTYGVNYERMVALKSRMDPNNLFHMNANVSPRKV